MRRIAVLAALAGIAAAIIALLPLKPPMSTREKPSWNAVNAEVSAWAERVSSGNADCPLPETRQTPCQFVRGGRMFCERTRTFVREVLPILESEPTMREKVVRAAQLAIDCEIFFGSCGRSAAALYALAGYSDSRNPAPTVSPPSSGCLFTRLGCGFIPPPRRIDDITMGIRNDAVIRNRKCTPSNPPRCYAGTSEATGAVKQELQRTLGTSWPDQWAANLEPGDWLIVYVGNSTPIGSHSIVFLGWQDEAAGLAWIFEGNAQPWSGEARGSEKVRLNTFCLKPACGQNYKPMIKVVAPE